MQESLVISGSLDELGKVHQWAKELLGQTALPEADRHNVLLALSEATTNAIRHGCKEERQKNVRISYTYDGQAVTLAVEDSGDGFSPEAVPDPTQGHQLYQAGGRGVYLLKALAREVRFDSSPDGTVVTFTFVRDL